MDLYWSAVKWPLVNLVPRDFHGEEGERPSPSSPWKGPGNEVNRSSLFVALFLIFWKNFKLPPTLSEQDTTMPVAWKLSPLIRRPKERVCLEEFNRKTQKNSMLFFFWMDVLSHLWIRISENFFRDHECVEIKSLFYKQGTPITRNTRFLHVFSALLSRFIKGIYSFSILG